MTADFSDRRRAVALAVLRENGIATDPDLSFRAKLHYAVALVVCDETGYFTERQLTENLLDPSVTQYADNLLRIAAEDTCPS